MDGVTFEELIAHVGISADELSKPCSDGHITSISLFLANWQTVATHLGLTETDEEDVEEEGKKTQDKRYKMLQRWKNKNSFKATYRVLVEVFLKLGRADLAEKVCRLLVDEAPPPLHINSHTGQSPTKDHQVTEPHNRRWKVVLSVVMYFFALGLLFYYQSISSHQPVKNSIENYTLKYAQYVDNVKLRYKTHLHDVAQSFWLPTKMHTFIQLSLTSRDKPHAPIVDEDSPNTRIVSERSMTFDHLLSEIDASQGSRILVVGQPGIGKTTLLQMITRSWAHDKALSSCWILLLIVLRDLVLLQHAPNLTSFLSFMGSTVLPPDIENHVLESDGKGLCFIADGLDEYPAGYEDKTNFIFSLVGEQKTNIKLPQSTVVISSRPEVASRVQHLFNITVEVLGFGNDQIKMYIQEKYGEDKSFSSYLDDHPHIKHTCYIPLHLAMLVYLKDSLPDDASDNNNRSDLLKANLPETETDIYEQFIIHTLIRDFCKDPTSSCNSKNILPSSLNNVNELNSPKILHLLFHIANLSYNGIQKRQSIFTEVSSVLQNTNSSLLVVDRMSVFQPTTYSFPHLTIQEFLAAFYFNTYLGQQEQKRVLVECFDHPLRQIFWKFCCGLKRNENQTTFFEFFMLLYRHSSNGRLPYHCAHEAQSQIASQQLINFTEGIVKLGGCSYYDFASLAFVAASAAENVREIMTDHCGKYTQFFLRKLCNSTTNYSHLREVWLFEIYPSNAGCLLQKSPNLESLYVTGLLWMNLQSEDAAALLLPSYGATFLYITSVTLNNLNIGDEGVKKLSQILQNSTSLETLSLTGNGISDEGASTIAELMKALPHLRHVYLSRNHIGGHGAALLWNQSFYKCSYLRLTRNVIGDNRPDAFMTALVSTINSGYEGNKSCQVQVGMSHNKLLCSDLREIQIISTKLPKRVHLITGEGCLELIYKIWERIKYYTGEDVYRYVLQWISCAVCTLHISHSTQTPQWSLLYLFCCFTIYILSSYIYLMWIYHFNFFLSLLWSWIVMGSFVFYVSHKLLYKPWSWVLIIAMLVQLYFTDLTLIDYQVFAFLYILLILGYLLFDLGLFPLWYYVGICCCKLRFYLGYEF